MPGAPDPLYVAARRALLDALEAIREHLDALVLVGAQAVYIHAGEGDLAVAPYTTDADLALDPAILGPEPLIQDLMARAGFWRSGSEVGVWTKSVMVEGVARSMVVDLLVPQAVGGLGRRGARIPPHDDRAARKVSGLEGALIDRERRRIGSLDSQDDREFEVAVAGPGALLVAKMVKIGDRAEVPGRGEDKDALDVLRLLQAVPTDDLARRLGVLRGTDLSRAVTNRALIQFEEMFAERRGLGSRMAARAAAPLEVEETVAGAAEALAQDLLDALRRAEEPGASP